jgi:hypothetical protein
MKTLRSALLSVSIACIIPVFQFAGNKDLVKEVKRCYIPIAELTKHQWTIAEYSETVKDTVHNMTLAMMPCEKDQELKYDIDNNYRITEGAIKCNAAGNTWKYVEADSMIIEESGSARPIEKTIISLDEGLLKIRYDGEAGKTITITYLSELGKKDDAKKDQYVDNADPLSYITQLIREDLIDQNNCTILSLGDFTKGLNKNQGKSSSLWLTVVPLADQTDPDKTIDLNERNNTLITQGQKSGLNFIVTGSLLSLKKDKTQDGKPSAKIKYRITILDVKKGEIKEEKTFLYPEPPKEKGKGLKMFKKVMDVAAPTAIIAPALLGGGNSINKMYALMYASQAASAYGNTASVFSKSINESERKEQVESSLSVMDAIESTHPDLTKFLKEKVD